MKRALLALLGVVLALIGLAAGGCSVVFSTFSFGSDSFAMLLWLLGFVVAAAAFWLAYRVFKRMGSKQE